MWLYQGQRTTGCVPHSILLQFVRRAVSVNKCALFTNADTPVAKRGRRRIAAGTKARNENGGRCGCRIRHLMASDSGALLLYTHFSLPPRRETLNFVETPEVTRVKPKLYLPTEKGRT